MIVDLGESFKVVTESVISRCCVQGKWDPYKSYCVLKKTMKHLLKQCKQKNL